MNPKKKKYAISIEGQNWSSSNRTIPLGQASELVKVPYHTFITANRQNRLKLIRRKVDGEIRLDIEIVVLCEYMTRNVSRKYRWKPKLVPISQIATREELQPRAKPNDSDLLANLDQHLANGGATTPIWVIKYGDEIILVDGARRLEAHQRSNRAAILVIELQLPISYAEAIAFEANLRHGRNLSAGDQAKRVVAYLAAHPSERQALVEGRNTQGKLAEQLGVSEATLSRVLAKEPTAKPTEIPAKKILKDFLTLLKPGAIGKLTEEENSQYVVIGCKTFATLHAQIPREDRPAIIESIEKQTTRLSKRISPLLSKMLDRRGGNRRLKSRNAKKNQETK